MQKSLLFLLFFCVAILARAQTKSISGKVSAPDNEALPGVNVLVKGSNVGTATKADGTYQINVPAKGGTLVFSFIGYKSKEVEMGNQSNINVALEADLVNLNEVVVTANAIVREKKELGYAVSTVNGVELTKARDPNLLNSLAGKVAGVRISQQSGTVGGSSRVMIRGANSISSASEPLFVVDGVPISNSSFNNSETDAVTGGVDVGNRAGDLNPDDIENMTVLKGAAASALYGSRARNGVIVITTKRGKIGAKKMNVTINSSYRSDNVLRAPELQTEYAQGNLGAYNPQSGNGWGPKISSVTGPVKDYKGEDVSRLQAYPDNWKNFFVTGQTAINSVSLDGANDQGDYRFGYTNLRQTGTVPNSELTRNTFSFNAGKKITDKLTSRAWVNYIRTTSDGRPQQGSNTTNIIATILAGTPVTVDINELKNNLFAPATQAVPPGWTGDLARSIDLNGVQNNPYFVTEFNRFSNTVDRMFGGTSLSYDVAPWFNVTGRVGTDFFTENRRSVTRRGTRGRLNGQFDTNDIFERELQTDLLATVSRKISKDWGFKGIIGHQFNQRTIRRSRVQSEGLNIDRLYTFANAQSNVPSNFFSRRDLFGVYGDFSFDYKNFLFLNVTGRNDWSSTLPVSNNSYFYPSASASFVLTEAFSNWGIVKKDILSYAKLRANYANVGSDEDPYQLSFTYNPLTQASDIYTFNILYPIGGASAFGATNVLPPTNLRPQQQTSYEFGAELKFFGGRVGLDMTYYKTLNYDQIISIAVPQSTGYSARRLNVGEISNKGLEAMLTVTPIKTRSGARWDMAFNFNRNINRVESLAPGLSEFIVTSGDGFGIFIAARPGETFNIQGVGWLRDPDGNIVINPTTGLRTPGPRKLLGAIYPDWTMGINNSFSYKGFDFNFLVDIRKGGVINSQTVSIVRGSGLAAETAVNDRTPFIDPGVIRNADGTFRPNDKPVASVQQYWSQLDNSVSPENNMFDGSYSKLREVRLAYNFPKSLVNKTPFGSIAVGLEGRNLWIITSNVPHIDPEANVLGTGLIGEGLERGSIPSSRTVGANLRFTF
ncbi:MAG: SusC/RagA family TonB-linked outer membrane protein [Cytophagia bacterium]|nr:MAG: SusC/RagA family TonB-linked outer membrane protein [Cytophagales bacterium]TAG39665.1 MAG: SusC/RagA family TonB-linked outer membrane protein [Cytophagia bacterium]TAG75040.1 MAG: SusC/RagA family TonB-linked outer membrane protein [Runella slithyformis]TAG81271.1 MAG: SusC/RagA family TonB-linked outer membrane protein [Cytophagales bacterium]